MPPENKPQRQDSLLDQLKDLIPIATSEGMYDAADLLLKIVRNERQRVSFAYGNVKMHNQDVTREQVERQAQKDLIKRIVS